MIRRYFESVRVLMATEILLRLRGLILIPILTKYFGAVSYGIWTQVSVIASMLSPVLALGLDSAVLRFLPGKDQREIARGFYSVTTYLLIASLVTTLALGLGASPIAAAFFSSPQAARYVAICGGLILVGLLLNQCRNLFRIVGNAKGYAAMALVQATTGVSVGVGVALCHGTVWSIVWLTLLADAGLLLVTGAVIVRRLGFSRPDWRTLGKYIRFGLPLVPAGYAMWALNSSDRLFIGHYGTLGDIGVYSVVYSLGYALVGVIVNPIWLMYPPRAAEAYNRGDLEQLRRLFRVVTKASLGLLIPAAVGFTVLARPVLEVIASAEFVRGAYVAPLVTLAYLLLMMSSFFDVSLGLVGRQGWSTVNIMVGMAANVSLNFLLVPMLGILGAAFTTLIGFGLQFALSASLGSRFIRLSFDFSFLLKAMIASAVMGGALAVLPAEGHVWMLPPAIVLGATLYVALIIALRALTPAELRSAVQVLKPSRQIRTSSDTVTPRLGATP
jgi:O-antigen/teichoic acid export membrane protein